MPDVSSNAPAKPTTYVALDVHKLSIVAGVLPASGGEVELLEAENTERSLRHLIKRLGGPEGLAVCYEAGPCGYDLLRLLSGMEVACDVIAPSLIPTRAGDRVKTDRRDARKLVRLYRAGELSFVAPPTPAQEGLRDLGAALTTSSAPGAPPVIASPRRCFATAASGAAGRRPGPRLTTPGSTPKGSRTPSPTPRWSRCGPICRPSMPRSPRSSIASRRWPAPIPGQTPCAGFAPSAASRPAPPSACSPRSATSAASLLRAS